MTKGTKFKLPSASKAGMQKKQGRNFLLPKEKPKRGFGIPMPKPKPMPRPGDPLRPRLMKDLDPAKRLQIKKLKEKLKKLMGDAKPTGRPSFRERTSKSKMK
jgi:hypothetical protein